MPIVIVLLLWPLIEIAGFAWIGGAIGVGPTLGFVVVSAVCWAWCCCAGPGSRR